MELLWINTLPAGDSACHITPQQALCFPVFSGTRACRLEHASLHITLNGLYDIRPGRRLELSSALLCMWMRHLRKGGGLSAALWRLVLLVPAEPFLISTAFAQPQPIILALLYFTNFKTNNPCWTTKLNWLFSSVFSCSKNLSFFLFVLFTEFNEGWCVVGTSCSTYSHLNLNF